MKNFRPYSSGTTNPNAEINDINDLFTNAHLRYFMESTDFISLSVSESKSTPNQHTLSVVRQSIDGKSFKQVVGFLVGFNEEEIELINKFGK